jgi:ribonuclease HI
LNKFNKLQNSALLKILGAFKNSPVSAMEIEAALPPTKVRFEKLCKNYALRILQMQDSHSVKQRVTSLSSFFDEMNLTELNSTSHCQLADWNQQLSYSESESEPEYWAQRLRKKKETKLKKQRKLSSQLFKLCSLLKSCFTDSSQHVESFNSKWNSPWKQSSMNIQIDSSDKIIAAENHRKLVLALQQNHSENILIYSDDSKQINCAGAEAYISSSIDRQQSCYWHLNSTVEAFDTELFAMFKSLQQAKAHVNSLTKNIWIFSDNQAAIQRISNSSCSSDQEISYKMQCEAESLLSQNIQLHICWVPSHVDIYDNEQADKAAKIAAAAVSTGFGDNIIDCSSESSISLTYLKSQVKKSLLKS